MIRSKFKIRLLSLITALFFVGSTFGVYAQSVTPVQSAPIPSSNLAGILGTSPELGALNGNLYTLQNTLKQIETTAIPIYNAVAPSNMEAMSIGERIKAILGNSKTIVQNGLQSYKGDVGAWNQAHGITPDTSFEAELGIGMNQLGAKVGEMPLGGNGNAIVGKLKVIIAAIKDKLQALITLIRSKILAVAQKVGLAKKTEEKSGAKSMADAPEPIQYADNFSGKMAKGVAEGKMNAKASLKNSFSLTGLAVTTTVAVGTNLAMQVINGQKPSFKGAVKMVTTAEFAGSVAGSALGAAGGQFAASMVRSFLPGPIGAVAGALMPVLLASAGGTVGSSLAGDLKNGQFSIGKALRAIDPVDLVGSSIGSTVGMMLGAPIPIIGPIIGGIVGGVIGGKVAKWVVGFFKGSNSISNIINRGQNISIDRPAGSTITVGGGPNTGSMSGTTTSGMYRPAADQAASPELKSAEKNYYETYMKYNKLVEQAKYDDAKKLYGDLQKYSDQYNQLKGRTAQ